MTRLAVSVTVSRLQMTIVACQGWACDFISSKPAPDHELDSDFAFPILTSRSSFELIGLLVERIEQALGVGPAVVFDPNHGRIFSSIRL